MRSAGSDAALHSAVAGPCQAGPRRRPVPAAGPGTGVNARGEQDKLWLGDEQDGTTRRFPGTKPPRLVHELTASQRRVRAFRGRELALPWEQGTPPQPTQPRHPPRLPRGGPVGPAAGAGPVCPPTPALALRGPARRGALRPPPLPCAPLLSPASFEATLQSF